MFDKIKNMLGGSAVNKVVDKISPELTSQLEVIKTLDINSVRDDEMYKKVVVGPSYMSVVAASGSVAQMIPGFENKFSKALIHIRNELVIYENDKPNLAKDFKERLPSVLKESLKA